MFCYFNLKLVHGQKVTFWYLSFFSNKYLVALSKAGLIFNPVPAISTSTAGGGDSPSYSGFFHCLAVSDDQSSPCLNPRQLCIVEYTKCPSTALLSRVDFWFIPCNLYSNLHDYLFANKLILKSISVFNCI